MFDEQKTDIIIHLAGIVGGIGANWENPAIFFYVEDTAEAIILATERYNESDPVNIGTGYEIKIKDLVKLIGKITGFRKEILWDKTKPGGQPRRKLDTSRAEEEFWFKSKTNLEEGLKKTIDWYLSTPLSM